MHTHTYIYAKPTLRMTYIYAIHCSQRHEMDDAVISILLPLNSLLLLVVIVMTMIQAVAAEILVGRNYPGHMHHTLMTATTKMKPMINTMAAIDDEKDTVELIPKALPMIALVQAEEVQRRPTTTFHVKIRSISPEVRKWQPPMPLLFLNRLSRQCHNTMHSTG
jgi:hypothetical protein